MGEAAALQSHFRLGLARSSGASKNFRMRKVILVLGALILILAVVAVVERDKIAGLILKGGDVSLMGEAAQNSPQAKIAIDFVTALRAKDKEALARLARADQVARIEEETQATPAADSEPMSVMMLKDLPEDPAELRGKIKSVQTHKENAVVLFDTKSNSWFIQLVQADGSWKVAGF